MRPLREARLTGIRGLAFDVDDTLTTRGRLTAPAYAALDRLAAAGLELVAVTGRPLGWTDAFASSWPVRVAVGENGAGWAWREGHALRLGYASDEDTRRTERATLDAIRAAVRERMPDVIESTDSAARRCDVAFDVGETRRLPPDRIDALVALIEAHGARASVSSVHAHAMPGRWNKATGIVRALTEVTGEPPELSRWVFVGDSGNDAEAFAAFEHSVGVANVAAHLERLPCPPRFVTEGSRGEGFVELTEALLAARDG